MIGPALHSAGQQTVVTEVTRPLPSLAERGVATRDYPKPMAVFFWKKVNYIYRLTKIGSVNEQNQIV